MQPELVNAIMAVCMFLIILITIAFVVVGFKYFSVLETKNNNVAPASHPTSLPASTGVSASQNLVNDSELVAVITAAIMASMQTAGEAISEDGLVVRSIKKRGYVRG